MSNTAERLRTIIDVNAPLTEEAQILREAADEIERLNKLIAKMADDLVKAGGRELDKIAEIERLRVALRMFLSGPNCDALATDDDLRRFIDEQKP